MDFEMKINKNQQTNKMIFAKHTQTLRYIFCQYLHSTRKPKIKSNKIIK